MASSWALSLHPSSYSPGISFCGGAGFSFCHSLKHLLTWFGLLHNGQKSFFGKMEQQRKVSGELSPGVTDNC